MELLLLLIYNKKNAFDFTMTCRCKSTQYTVIGRLSFFLKTFVSCIVFVDMK